MLQRGGLEYNIIIPHQKLLQSDWLFTGFLPQRAGVPPLRQFGPPSETFAPLEIWSENNRKLA